MHYASTYRRGLYRSRRGIFLGVCQGLADYFDFSAFWIRIALIITFILTGFLPILPVYLIAALIMKPEPRYAY